MNQTQHEEVTHSKTTVTESQKLSAIKTLAIVGFIAAIVILVWLAVAVVRFIPDAFSTLASIAQSVSSPSRELTIKAEKDTVNVGEPFTISWTKTRREGVYGFTYECIDGLAGSLHRTESTAPISCDNWTPLPENTDSALISFSSEKSHRSDVDLKIRFISEGGDVTEKSTTVSVVNPELAETPAQTPQPVATSTPSVPVVTPAKPATTPARPQAPTAPISNPNGYTDLQTTYIGVGTYDERTKTFTLTSSIDNDSRAALRFSVVNVGTKTSGPWTYQATVPTKTGDTYRSGTQSPLIPGERAIVTVLWADVREKTGSTRITIEVDGGNDTKSGNNDVVRDVKISD